MRSGGLTVRQRVVVALVAVALGVAALIGGIGYGATAHVLQDEIDRSLASAAATLSQGGTVAAVIAQAEGPGRRDGGRGAGGGGDDGPQEGIVQSAQTVTAGGAVTLMTGIQLPVGDAARAVASATAGVQHVETVTVHGTDYRVLAVALGDQRGLIQVARELTVTENVLSDLAWTTVLIALAVLVVAALAGWFIARQITRRLTALTAAAERVGVTGRWELDVEPRGVTDEVGRLGEAMRSMLAELARSRDDQQRLVQDAGHELRTPLTSLRTNISVLRRFEELSADSRTRLLDDVRSEARELTDLVNELVDLATDRRDAETPEDFDLAAVADRVASVYRRRSGRVITVTAAHPTVVRGRRHAIERAVSNLVENAVKFDPAGSPVDVQIVPGDDAVAVAVSDRGPGLEAGDAERIFDRFHRSVAARSLPGSGLGLAIVRDVAVAHGGIVSATDRPGGGAVIGFTVRAAVAPDGDPESALR